MPDVLNFTFFFFPGPPERIADFVCFARNVLVAVGPIVIVAIR